MSIADVIAAASRDGEGFSEKKTFTLARRRAIEKMRKFALADPYFYILELIQAAVANGAEYIDINAGDGNLTMSYIGGYIPRDELAQLFDFLFASKERIDLAHVRSLALGVNAVLNFKPTRVIVESGDGTPEGTSRMVMREGAETVDVGQADRQLKGTFIRIEGLKRGNKHRTLGSAEQQGGGREYGVIETRCLTAPVPIIFNAHPMFGFSTQKIPTLLGYQKRIEFDEGDLYGVLGVNPAGGDASFQVLTYGVWVQSYQNPSLIPGQRLGGIVVFDRLHKTADHSGFVQDERFKEMWIRLRPYARQLISGKAARSHMMRGADGRELTTQALRELAERSPCLVVTRSDIAEELGEAEYGDQRRRAHAIAFAMNGELLEVDADSLAAVSSLVGDKTRVLVPNLTDERDVDFYGQPPSKPPAKPYLAAPFKMRTRSPAELAEQLVRYAQLPPPLPAVQGKEETLRDHERDRLLNSLTDRLGGAGDVVTTVYTAFDPGLAADGLLVRVWTTERELYVGLFESSYAGHEIVVELPDAPPNGLREESMPGVDQTLAELVAAEIANEAPLALAAAGRRTLDSLSVGEVKPGETGARLALSILARHCVARLRSTRAGRLSPGVALSMLSHIENFDPLELPVLATLDGQEVSLRKLGLLMDECWGLVYGVCEGIEPDLEGLDRSKVLWLSEHEERMLITLVGEANYVRVDRRDVLASTDVAGQTVVVRDVAMGLRELGDGALVTEGAPVPVDQRESVEAALLEQLIATVKGRYRAGDDSEWEAEERRRQCIRHLQWYACRQAKIDRARLLASPVADVPLFLDRAGRAYSIRYVLEALESGELRASLERSLGAHDLASFQARATNQAPTDLRASGFVFRLLQGLGSMKLAFDFDLDAVEAAHNPATPSSPFLARAEVALPSLGIRGVLGVPTRPPDEFTVQILDSGRASVHRELADAYGLCGTLQLESGVSAEGIAAITKEIENAGEMCLAQLLKDLAERDPNGMPYKASIQALLRYAGQHLELVTSPQGHPTVVVGRPLAEQILATPLFPGRRGMPLSAHRIAEIYCQRVEVDRNAKPWRVLLVDGLADYLQEWIESHLHPEAIVRPASHGVSRATQDTADLVVLEGSLSASLLAENLNRWLERLRPETWGDGLVVQVTDLERIPGHLDHLRADIGDGLGCLYGQTYVLSEGHFLVQRLLRAPAEKRPQGFAWLLLAIYAEFNAVHDPVTNDHEIRFQQAVGQALADQSLQLYGAQA